MERAELNIAILGTRGIPNRYGGFEACAEQLALGLTKLGHQVSVYCGHDHEVKDASWNGIHRILKHNPEKKLGSSGQFIYDLLCNLDSRKRGFDVILHMGYTSDSIWYKFWTGRSIHLVNMDGMEWQRAKYGRLTKRFLRIAERLATLRAHTLIADNPAIKEYLTAKYRQPVSMIAYGAEIPASFSEDILGSFSLKPYEYDLIVARMEPENHIVEAIKAKQISGDNFPLVIVSNKNKYASGVQKEFATLNNIVFTGPIYEMEAINSLRSFSRYYIHGHSVGGTNPSLLEAMACGCTILAHENPYNEAVLGSDARYFISSEQLGNYLKVDPAGEKELSREVNIRKITDVYNWDSVTRDYEKLIQHAVRNT